MREIEKTTVAHFLLRRLKEIGCNHVFGVPGDFVLGFLNELTKSEMKYIGTCNELNAGYAADAYARLQGVGCVCTTYGVGELSALNSIAGAFAENVPVIHLAGVPATRYYQERLPLHHTLNNYEAPLKIYQNVTVAQTILFQPENAVFEIDRVLRACLLHKLPVYIGIPADIVHSVIEAPKWRFVMPKPAASNPASLEEAVADTVQRLHRSKRPLLIPGIEIQRLGLQKQVETFLKAFRLPFATMILSKGVLDETHQQFIGVYGGKRSRRYVQQTVEESDCFILLGEKLTDYNTGGFSARLDQRNMIEVTRDSVRCSCHTYHHVQIGEFLHNLRMRVSSDLPRQLDLKPALEGCMFRPMEPFVTQLNAKLSMERFFQRLAYALQPGSIIIAETGVASFAAAELLLPRGTTFIGQMFYGAIGYTVGATLGACVAAPSRHVYLLIGDGSFQVACQEISTLIRHGYDPTVFLLNNDGYTIERVITDNAYNDIQPWKYHQLPSIFGGQAGYDCYTESDLEHALHNCQESHGLFIIEIHLPRWDCGEALRSAGHSMAQQSNIPTNDAAS